MREDIAQGLESDEATLRRELREAREKLEALVADLRLIDRELETLEVEGARFKILESVCSGLEELESQGAGELFWGDLQANPVAPTDRGQHLRFVRSRIAEYDKRLEEVEERRQAILEEIERHEDLADQFAGDVLDAEREAKLREHEWLVDREQEIVSPHPSTMPWTHGGEDDRRFRKTLAIALAASALLALLLPMIEIPLPERWEILEEQDRLTQLIRDELPPPTPRELTQTLAAEAEPEPVDASEETPIAAEEVVPESAPAATKAAEPSPASKGLLAFREKFTGLTDVDTVDRLGSNARISDPGDVAQGLPQRSMVTSQASSSSGGINVAQLSRDTGGGGQELGGVAVTQATSTIGSGTGSARPLAGGGPGLGRTDEEIQIVFDRHKAALYRLYNRELRKNPTLKGQIVLKLTIEPDGSVSLCAVKSSDMKAPRLASQVVERVKAFDFGAKDGIPAVTIIYPIDFLPAT